MGVDGGRRQAEAHDACASQAEADDGVSGGMEVVDVGLDFSLG